MPQIIIEYDIEGFDVVEQQERLAQNLALLCAELFSVDEWAISPDEFGFKFDKIEWPSYSTHNVIIRIALHNFEARVRLTEEHAKRVKNITCTLLMGYGHIEGTTVGVALSYLPSEWALRNNFLWRTVSPSGVA